MLGSLRHSARARVLAVLVVLLGVAGLVFGTTGGRLYDVATPSMGRAAPVGTLLVTRPTPFDDVRVGEIITFRNPAGEVYTHRVVARDAAGLRTRGDINTAPDAWTVRPSQLIGEVVLRVPAGGWLVRGLPLVLLVSGLLWGLGLCLRPSREDLLRLVRLPLALATTIVVLHLWVSLTQTATVATAEGSSVSAVSTGLMPVRMWPEHARGRGVSDVRPGQVATVRVDRSDGDGGRVRVAAAPDLDARWWAVVVLLCLAPMGLAVAIGLPGRTRATA